MNPEHDLAILTQFLRRLSPEVEGHDAGDPPEDIAARLDHFASGSADASERALIARTEGSSRVASLPWARNPLTHPLIRVQPNAAATLLPLQCLNQDELRAVLPATPSDEAPQNCCP